MKKAKIMKKRNLFLLALIALCLAIFCGYWAYDRARTDTTPPVIHIEPQPLEISVNAPEGILLQDVTAEDDISGDVTDSVVLESIRLLNHNGKISVGYAAFDDAGNVTKIQREVQYNNYRSPRFTLSGPLLYSSYGNFDVLNEVGATDSLDGDIPHRVRAMLTEDAPLTSLGTHMVQFQVTNTLGDTATKIFPVEIYDPTDYNATLTLKEYMIYLPVNGIFNAKFYPDTFAFRGNTYELSAVLPENYSLEIGGEVDTRTPGVYPVTYTLTYTEKNEWTQKVIDEYIGYSKLIVVVEG